MRHAVIALIGFWSGLLACSATKPTAPAEGTAADVSALASGGLWEAGERYGRYQVVVRKSCSPEHCFDSAALEWIESLSARDALVGSVPIKEINEHLCIVQSLRYVPGDQDGFELLLANTYTEEKAWLCVWPNNYPDYAARIIVESAEDGPPKRCSRRGPAARAADRSRF